MPCDPQPAQPWGLEQSARLWFREQVRQARERHGAAWPEHREWVIAYLLEELRGRIGDRPFLRRAGSSQ